MVCAFGLTPLAISCFITESLVSNVFGTPLILAGIFLLIMGFYMMQRSGNWGILMMGLGTLLMFFTDLGLFPPDFLVIMLIIATMGIAIAIGKFGR